MVSLKRLWAAALVSLVCIVGASAGAVTGSSALTYPLAGDTSSGEVYMLAGGTWHAISPAAFPTAGLIQQGILQWYDGRDFPGLFGEPATAQQVTDLATSLTATGNGSALSSASALYSLAGDTSSGEVYLLAGGTWHAISSADFAAAGLSQQGIQWYGGHDFPGLMGEPATAQQVAEIATSYTAALKVLGVTLPNPQIPIAAPTVPASVKPIIAKVLTVPSQAVAGKSFVVSFLVTRSDTGGLLTSGSMSSSPSVAGKVIYPHWEKFQSGTASVRLTIPLAAKGKVLKVPVTIKVGGESLVLHVHFQIK